MGGADFEALTEATSGAVGGLLSTTILYPLDTCKTKYQAEVRSGGSTKYRSLFDVLKEAISSGQILSLYQGLSTKSLQSIISQFIYFYSYSYLKTSYLRVTKKKNMGTGANLIVAAAAGTCTAVLTQPLDTASARMQTSTFGKSKGLCVTLSERSWKEAFDGLGPSLLLTSNPSIQYTVFEQIKIRLLRSQEMKKTDTGCGPSPLVLSAFSAFLLGAFSKTIATVMTYPAIRCKVMIQAAEPEEDKSKMNGYHKQKPPKKMAEALRLIWREEGAWGFYKGLHVQILKTVLSAALMLMIKEKTYKLTWIVLVAFRKWLSNTPKRLKQM